MYSDGNKGGFAAQGGRLDSKGHYGRTLQRILVHPYQTEKGTGSTELNRAYALKFGSVPVIMKTSHCGLSL